MIFWAAGSRIGRAQALPVWWPASSPIGPQDENVSGWTYLIVDVAPPAEDLEPYDSDRCMEEIDGYRTFHVPSALLDGKIVISMGGDISDLPHVLDGMSETEREAYLRAQQARYDAMIEEGGQTETWT
ncbi:hypothetical protein OJF2_05710 [Aquisphaera giovannonii]|uniref:Uncharacterized protein n=1 Tax=Aquisphaera giovannonii TaxID=406548 RepID=A0A5B9VV48_9BACT|nr:hypothetical protein [Aquisphaera giovannonii]QEH32102.1 hypothetical protein OJF2_05710 [Aquisphaera giovannonii]